MRKDEGRRADVGAHTHKREAQQHMGEEMGTDGEIRKIGGEGKVRRDWRKMAERNGRWRRVKTVHVK